MRATSDASAVRNAFYAVLREMPEDKLRKLITELLLAGLTPSPSPPPTSAEPEVRRKGGWPRGRARRNASNGPRRAAKADGDAKPDPKLPARRQRYAARVVKAAAKAAGNGEDTAGASPQAFWQHAEKLEPTKPWLAVAREFGVKAAVAQNCYRNQRLPPQVGPIAITKFLTLPAPA
jgi:hypothetical protein